MAVARTGNFRKAADILYISVSAVHRQIALAEDELGVTLFERLPNGLRLTLAGELLYSDLLKWQKEFQQTRIRFDEIQGLKRGTIEFGLISALSDGFVIDAIQHIHQTYPWINLHIQLNDSETITQRVMASELDFGIILEPVQHHQLDVIAFSEMPIGFVMSPDHPLALQASLSLSDTIDSRHIIADSPLIVHERVSAIYKKQQFIPFQQTLCNDIRVMISMLKRNMGIAILSYLDVHSTVQKKELVFIPLYEKGIQPLTLALCTGSKRQLSRASQVLMNLLVEKLEQFKESYPINSLGLNTDRIR